VVLTILLSAAFTVVAMAPASEGMTEDEFKPLEVMKERTKGNAVVVVNSPAFWELEITVINHLEPTETEPPVEEEEQIVFYSTRAEGDDELTEATVCENTITNVVVTDTFTSDFTLLDWSIDRGDVGIVEQPNGDVVVSWHIGNLEPKGRTTLVMDVCAANGGFTKPGRYLLNSGATVSGLWTANGEILTDGPTKPIRVTVTNGIPRYPPVAEAGITQMAFEDCPIYLDGSDSYDTDGTVIKYSWYLGDEKVGSSMNVLTYFPIGEHEVTLEVEDNHGMTATDTVTIIIYKEGTSIPGGVMYGIVRDATTRRGFDPYIVVSNDDFAISTWTDMGGNYRIIGIPAGDYEVTCETEGYRDFYGEISIEEDAEIEYIIGMIRR
jgi:hypothetical protein